MTGAAAESTAPPVRARQWGRWTTAAAGALLLLIFYLGLRPFFFNPHNSMGVDYSLFLPQLLDGYFWTRNNGVLSVQWFTPALCGGVPRFPNPQGMNFSVPQLLTAWLDPRTSIALTLVLFGGAGLAGTYALLRRGFATSRPAALLAGTVFLCNNFYAERMIFGHLTYHAFMLTPWLGYFLLRAAGRIDAATPLPLARDVIPLAGLLCYLLLAGMVNLLLPPLLILIVYLCIYDFWRAARQPDSSDLQRLWLPALCRLAAAGALSLCLMAAPLCAALSYLHQFPRDYYQVPTLRSLADLLWLVASGLFVGAPEDADRLLLAGRWPMGQEEFAFCVSCVPLLIFLSWGLLLLRRPKAHPPAPPAQRGRRTALLLTIAAILVTPLVLNANLPAVQELLKQVPVLSSSSTFLRWFSLYIPIAALLCGLAFDALPLRPGAKAALAGLGMAAVLAQSLSTDRSAPAHSAYDATPLLRSYRRVQRGQWTPVLKDVIYDHDLAGKEVPLSAPNDVLVLGASQLICYEPMFGYKLERFPRKGLHLGPALAEHDGYLNVKNPACYVYPAENGCAPGDHFRVTERDQAERFLSYRPFPFQISTAQRWADRLSGLAFLLTLGWAAGSGLSRARRRA